MTRFPTILALTILLALPSAQEALGQTTKKRLRQENLELRARLDSIRAAFDELKADYQAKDSIANELTALFKENEDKVASGLNPGGYSPDITDSLLNIWHLHNRIKDSDEGEGFDLDSVRFTSNVPDSVLRARLERMHSFLTLPYNETVRNYIVLYSEKMKTKMGAILGLCQYYMPIFEETFSKYDLPDELKYVAIIESALNPVAVSRAGAKGLWQFMIRTAKSYGLEINSYVDERFDPFKSADAAARYLRDSYKLFGDWNLAISSYNCGPGNVNKAIRRSGSREFWDIYKYLPRETRGYVPAMVGAMYAIKYAKENGLSPSGVPMPVQVDTFEIRRSLHFLQLSEVAGIPIDEIRNLNPQYIREIIPGDSIKPYILRLPFNYTGAFLSCEDSVYKHKAGELFNPQVLLSETRPSSASSSARISYTVRKGDYLGKIAAKYRVSVNQLKDWNNLKNNNLRIGQKLYIYGGSGSSSAKSPTANSSTTKTSTTKSPATTKTPSSTAPNPTSNSSASTASAPTPPASSAPTSSDPEVVYTVKKGDTVSGIAKNYPGVTAAMIMKLNGITSSIHPGMKLRIPVKD